MIDNMVDAMLGLTLICFGTWYAVHRILDRLIGSRLNWKATELTDDERYERRQEYYAENGKPDVPQSDY